MNTEQNNKIRLNQARRQAVQKRTDKADSMPTRKGERGSVKREKSNWKRLNRRRKMYGGTEEEKEAEKRKKRFKGLRSPLATAKKAKDIATAPTKIQSSDIPIYGTAFILAGLKDLLDLSFIGSLPGIGTAITFCISIAIGFVLLFDGVSGFQKKVARRLARRYLVLIAGTMVEGFLFGLNFFPFEILTVAIIYWMSLADRKR